MADVVDNPPGAHSPLSWLICDDSIQADTTIIAVTIIPTRMMYDMGYSFPETDNRLTKT